MSLITELQNVLNLEPQKKACFSNCISELSSRCMCTEILRNFKLWKQTKKYKSATFLACMEWNSPAEAK